MAELERGSADTVLHTNDFFPAASATHFDELDIRIPDAEPRRASRGLIVGLAVGSALWGIIAIAALLVG